MYALLVVVIVIAAVVGRKSWQGSPARDARCEVARMRGVRDARLRNAGGAN